MVQGDESVDITPFSGDQPVEKLYDLRIPSKYEGDNGATDPGTGPYFQSVGTQDLQRESTTICFLYDGPNGLSFVVVHDTNGGDGGAATWTVESVPEGAKWRVKDDLYLDPETGEPAATNYDKWNVSGTTHEIDWTWGSGGTDGGVLGYFDGTFAITIHPAYNAEATLYGKYYEGDVTAWEVLSASDSGLERESLSLDEPVKLVCVSPDAGGDGDETESGDDEGDEDESGDGDDHDEKDPDDDDGEDHDEKGEDQDHDEKDDEKKGPKDGDHDEKDDEDEDEEEGRGEDHGDEDTEMKAELEEQKREWQRMKKEGDPEWREAKREWQEAKREWNRGRGNDD
ncbi:hypothetical protein VB779_15435 [Haloarculaceae archaeon H-GB11]|nr:hypothetical protein [Haloarculaceae archaeon H-GB11]